MLSIDLSGKTALVGGSTQGIGLASAQAMASLGARCVLMSRNEEKLKAAVATLDTSAGQQHTYLVADYSQPQQVQEAVAAATFRKLSLLLEAILLPIPWEPVGQE